MGSIQLDLENLRMYALELSQILDSHTKVIVAEVEAKAKKMSKESRDEWYEWNEDAHWQLSDVFPSIMQDSLFVTTYSYLESALASIVKKLANDNPKPVKLQELRGDGLQLFKTYLNKVQEIDFPDNSSEWQRISTYRRIRNFIVHNDRKLEDSKNADIVRQFSSQYPQLVSINRFNKISITKECNTDFIDRVEKFFSTLLDKIS